MNRSRSPRVPLLLALVPAGLGACATLGSAPVGSDESIPAAEQAARKEVGGKAKGKIVWSSSRVGHHDIFVMDSDGSNVKALTQGDETDWFPRFSPDGGRVLFTRSRKGWVEERDANTANKWDIWVMNADGSDQKKVVTNASWGNWIGPNEIVYVRATQIFRRDLGGDAETPIMDSHGVAELDGALLQQPQMSRDGKYIAITLRGSRRETGIWDVFARTWTKTGLGCQINWTPDGQRIYWVNPTGNGGSEVFQMPIAAGKPQRELSDDELKFIDIPGRRSHEYFPQLSADGRWLVWGATQRGHDHDIADYEIYIWELGTPADKATRLTFHSGNDRWPDIFISGASSTAAATQAAPASAEPAAAAPAVAPPTDADLVKAAARPKASRRKK
jgi:hypothetical protein